MVEIIRGNVVLCDLNPVIGTEQSGIRPVVVVQLDRANKIIPHTIIVLHKHQLDKFPVELVKIDYKNQLIDLHLK